MEGFGINTNVLETNVLNLAVVIGVLFVLGKDVLTSLLDERKSKIVQSLDEVEARYLKAQAQLEQANAELSLAVDKAKEIQAQSAQTAAQTCVASGQRAEAEIVRLKGAKTSTIAVEKQKLVREMRTLLKESALSKAFTTLKEERSGSALQKRLIDNLLREVFDSKKPQSV